MATIAPDLAVVVSDDHAMVRSALRAVLESEPGVRVVGEAPDLSETVRVTLRHRPDVVVMDLHMHEAHTTAADVLALIRKRAPKSGIVVLSPGKDLAVVREALSCGADGYVPKTADAHELVDAVRAVGTGGTYVHPLVEAGFAKDDQAARRAKGGLTDREVEILRLVALGHTSREVGRLLSLSVRTVESHRTNIVGKLVLHTRSQLVRHAMDQGLMGAH